MTGRYLLDIPVEDVPEFEDGLLEFVDTKYPEIFRAIRETKEMSDDTERRMQKAIDEFRQSYLRR